MADELPVFTLQPYEPIDVDLHIWPQPTKLTVVYLVRCNGSRLAWLCCFGDHAVLWWLPAEHVGITPDLRNAGWSIGSPYPDAQFWSISGRFSDALEYIYNGLRVEVSDGSR